MGSEMCIRDSKKGAVLADGGAVAFPGGSGHVLVLSFQRHSVCGTPSAKVTFKCLCQAKVIFAPTMDGGIFHITVSERERERERELGTGTRRTSLRRGECRRRASTASGS